MNGPWTNTTVTLDEWYGQQGKWFWSALFGGLYPEHDWPVTDYPVMTIRMN